MEDTFEAPEKIHILVSGYDAAELYIVHEYGTGNLVALTNTERVLFAAELEHRYNTYATLVEALGALLSRTEMRGDASKLLAVGKASKALALASRKDGDK